MLLPELADPEFPHLVNEIFQIFFQILTQPNSTAKIAEKRKLVRARHTHFEKVLTWFWFEVDMDLYRGLMG